MSAEVLGEVNTWTNGGVLLVGGDSGRTNRIQGIKIENNSIDTPTVGINLVGGYSRVGAVKPAIGNRIEDISLHCNFVTSAPLLAARRLGRTKGIMLIGGDGMASDNIIQDVTLSDNLVVGIPDDVLAVDNSGFEATDNHAGVGSSP